MAALMLGAEIVAVELHADGGGRTIARSAVFTVVEQPAVRRGLPPAQLSAAAAAAIVMALAGPAATEMVTGRAATVTGDDRQMLTNALDVFPTSAERAAALAQGWRRARELVASREGRRFVGWLGETLARTRRVDGKVCEAIFAVCFGRPLPSRVRHAKTARASPGPPLRKSRAIKRASPLARVDVWRPGCPIEKAA